MELSGRVVKAANTRSLVPYVVELARRALAADPTNARLKHMYKVVESLNAAYELMYAAGYFLSDTQAATLASHLTRMGLHFQRVAMGAEEGAWRMRPKLHYAVAHLAPQAVLINPRFVQTYGSEGMVGKVCGIYKAPQNGPYGAGLQLSMFDKYRTGVVLSFAH